MAIASASTDLNQLWSYLPFPMRGGDPGTWWSIDRRPAAPEYKETKIMGKSPTDQEEFICQRAPAMAVARIEPDRRLPFQRPFSDAGPGRHGGRQAGTSA